MALCAELIFLSVDMLKSKFDFTLLIILFKSIYF